MPDTKANLLRAHRTQTANYAKVGGKLLWCLIPIPFAVFLVVSCWYGISERNPDAIFFVSLFAFMFVASVAAPFLQSREKDLVTLASVVFAKRQIDGVLIHFSAVAKTVFTIGAPIFFIAGVVAAIVADDPGQRAKATIAAIAYLVVCCIAIWRGLNRKFGILIAPDGLVFSSFFHLDFVAWDSLSAVEVARIQDGHIKSQALCVMLKNDSLLALTKPQRTRFLENRRRKGCHLSALASNLRAPISSVADLISFYKSHPEARPKLLTPDAVKIASDNFLNRQIPTELRPPK